MRLLRSAAVSTSRQTGRPRLNPRESAGDPSDEIMAVASRLFRERGVAATTMSQIAKEAGLQQSSLYYYFRSKEDVLSAIVAKANVVPLEHVAQVQRDGGPASVRLFRFVRGDVAALCALPFDINEVHRYAARDRERFARYWRERRRLERTLVTIISEGITDRELRDVEPRLAALTIMSNDEAVQNWYRLDTVPTRRRRRDRDVARRADGRRPAQGLPPPGHGPQAGRHPRRLTEPLCPLARGLARLTFRRSFEKRSPFATPKRGRNARPLPSQQDREREDVPMTGSRWQRAAAGLSTLALVAIIAACGGDDDDTSTDTATAPAASSPTTAGGTDVAGGDTGPAAPPAATTPGGTADDTPVGDGATLRVGYSAWPGWFPLAVAEEQGFFADAGVDVELTFFVDYIASLDALSAGSLDVNTQTLNDTIFAVAAGSPQRVIATNDNSTGNDAIICDESIGSVPDLAGKSIAAEPGVVDHFLLLQGLAEEGMTEADIEFQGLPTAAAAAAFAGGEFDCVGVFAPFTVQALERPGSKVLFSSADFPGVISDHFVATADAVEQHPDELQRLVEAWYMTLDWIAANPEEATAIMAAKAEVTPEEYEDFAEGTTIFSDTEALDSFEDRSDDPTSLPEMARRINPFLVESGLAEQEADLTDLFVPEYTATYIESAGG